MSSILLLQQRNNYGEVINRYFSADTLNEAYIDTKFTLYFGKAMNTGLTESIKDVLKVGPHLDTRLPNDL